jgi:cobyrinic acid a,c-diamide synthase
VIAGLAGDAGKTLVSCGLARALTRRGRRVAVFKKGPDYIDAAWLGAAVGRAGRNLDTYLMPTPAILASLAREARYADIAVVEGNRGLFDGLDADGHHSTAELAKLIGAGVLLIVDASKTTRTVAAQVLGCIAMDRGLSIAGVIVNRVATSRQEALIRQAVEATTGVQVLGAIPRQSGLDLPSRHLGLVTVAEHPRAEAMLDRASEIIESSLDLEAITTLADRGTPLKAEPAPGSGAAKAQPSARVGVLRDAAFSFYYPENLEALEREGAELVEISPLADAELPDIDALYAGGGFPEVYAAALASNAPLRRSLRQRIAEGLPVWAECGGLMYLAEKLVVDGVAHEMVGTLPVVVTQEARPQGHGYVAAHVDRPNPFLPPGCAIKGHEFHYSRITAGVDAVSTVFAVDRGTGVGGGRDGIEIGNVVASYAHVHASGIPEWAPGVVAAARGECWPTCVNA